MSQNSKVLPSHYFRWIVFEVFENRKKLFTLFYITERGSRDTEQIWKFWKNDHEIHLTKIRQVILKTPVPPI